MSKPLDIESIKMLASLNQVVHAPGRLAILAVLEANRSAEFSVLQKQTDLTRGNLSSHLLKLESAGYVIINKTFVERVPCTQIQLTDLGREEFASYRRQLQAFLGVPSQDDFNSDIFRRYRERMRQMFDMPPTKKA